MKSILTTLTGSKARFAFTATFIASIFVFVVVPALPNIGSDTMTDGFSVSALVSFAQDSGGGDGGGDAGGGDSGGGDSGGGSGGGDAGTGCCGDTGGDTGTGDGGGDAGTGCCDGGGTTDPGTGGDSGGSTPVLSCTLTINPESITTGSSATVSWTTANAASVSITNLGAVALNGSRTISPTTNTTYTLTATGAGDTVTCTDSITVIPVVVNPPVCTLTASPTTITAGQSSTVTWTTQNATNVSLNQSIGTVAVQGSRSVTPSANTIYTLTATGLGGSVTCSAPVTVTPVVTPGQCVLEISKTVNKTNAVIGDTLIYTLNFRNSGTADCTGGGVRVIDFLPTEVAYLSETHSSNVTAGYGTTPVYQSEGNLVTWNADVLTPGESGSATITVQVKPKASCGNYSIANKGKISSAEYNNFTTWVHSNVVTTNVTNACEEPRPVCTLDGAPSTITSGQAATLTWTTENATTATLDQSIGTVVLDGNRSVSPTTNTTYILTATGPGGSVTCVKTIAVTPVIPDAPVCTLTGAPSTITRGQNATLTWTTQNATSASLDQSIGAVAQNGNRSVSPTANTTYTLTATGPGGSVTCVKTITVEEPEVPQPLTCDAFTAAPGTLTTAGTTTLTWATSNATNVSIDNGIGGVAVDGSREVLVNANTTYTLTATRGTETKTCSVPVTIVPNVVVPRCDTFTVSPNSVRRGNAVILAWETTNASQVTIDQGIGSVSADGSRSVTVDGNTTYVLTATNGSANTSCQASVSLESDGGGGGGGGGGSSSPRCTLKASDEKIKAGEKVTLSWKNTRTNEILLKDNRGNELIDTEEIADEKKYNEDADSIDVRPTKSTSYTLTAYKGSKKRTCTVDIQVENISVTSTRSNTPLVAGISLSNVPYTGFDAGPFLTTVFYMLLLVWALAVAYILVIRRESVLGVSLQGGTRKTASRETRNFTDVIEPSVVFPTMATPRVTAPEVSRMAYIPSVLTPPRLLPHGDMATKFAPVGYEALYEGYGDSAPVIEEEYSPANLPVGEPFEVTDDSELLESRAQDAHILISTDALNFIQAQSKVTAERIELLDVVINAAKAHYPKEDGWVVVNKERIFKLLA